MGTHNRLMTVLFVSLLAIAADNANAKKPADRGDADAGRDLALQACTGCHVAKGAWRTHTLPTTNSPTWRLIS